MDSENRDSTNNIEFEGEDFVKVRCYKCGKVLFEAGAEATGRIRKKCGNNRCKDTRIISLPLNQKKANLQPVGA